MLHNSAGPSADPTHAMPDPSDGAFLHGHGLDNGFAAGSRPVAEGEADERDEDLQILYLAQELQVLHSARIQLVGELTRLKMKNSSFRLYAQHLITVLDTLKVQNRLLRLQLYVCQGPPRSEGTEGTHAAAGGS